MSLIHKSFLHAPPLTTIIYSDASLEGWGLQILSPQSGPPWQVTDALMHINVLELTAAHFALLHLAADARGIHIQLKLDNLTAVAYINKMGGTPLSRMQLSCTTDLGVGGRKRYLAFCSLYSRRIQCGSGFPFPLLS